MFELRLLSAIGFMPQLISCGACGETNAQELVRFHPAEGTVFCKSCAHSTDALVISPSLRQLMLRSVSVSEKEAYALKLDEELLFEFSSVTERYVLAQLQREFKTLSFYHQMKDV